MTFLLVSTISCGQTVFRTGYIIKKNGQVASGLIKYSLNQDVPEVCVFKYFDIALEMKYGPEEINEFSYIRGNRYVSKTSDKKTSFYEILVSGEINLYLKGSKYYVERGTSGLIQVTKGKIEYYDSKGTKTFNNVSSLLSYLTGIKTTDNKASKDKKEDLQQEIIEFNNRLGKPYFVYSRTYSENKLLNESFHAGANRNKFGINAGVNIYKLMLKPKKGQNVGSLNPEYSATGGVSYERVLSKKNDRLTFRADMLILKQEFYSYFEGQPSGVIVREDSFYGFTAIKVPLQFQYSFSSGKLVPYLSAGASVTRFITSNYHHIKEIEYSTHEISTLEDSNMKFRGQEICGVISAGIRMRIKGFTNLNIQGQFEIGNGLFQTEKFQYIQNSIQPTILIGFIF